MQQSGQGDVRHDGEAGQVEPVVVDKKAPFLAGVAVADFDICPIQRETAPFQPEGVAKRHFFGSFPKQLFDGETQVLINRRDLLKAKPLQAFFPFPQLVSVLFEEQNGNGDENGGYKQAKFHISSDFGLSGGIGGVGCGPYFRIP